MTPVWGGREHVVPFVAGCAGIRPDFGNCRTMAVLDRENRMVAGIVFHDWSPEHGVIEISAAAIDRRWATRGVLKAAFGYVFGTCGCQLAVARTAVDNRAARRLWTAFGAREYIIPRLRGRDVSEVIITLTQEDWAASRLNEG
ncbi:MAG: GNAT family protein [Pseudomonadota bacterium]